MGWRIILAVTIGATAFLMLAQWINAMGEP